MDDQLLRVRRGLQPVLHDTERTRQPEQSEGRRPQARFIEGVVCQRKQPPGAHERQQSQDGIGSRGGQLDRIRDEIHSPLLPTSTRAYGASMIQRGSPVSADTRAPPAPTDVLSRLILYKAPGSASAQDA